MESVATQPAPSPDRGAGRLSTREKRAGAAVLACHVLLLAYGATVHSPTVDEIGHLPAGIYHWQTGRFELYRVNPPLVRLVACLPLAAWMPRYDWTALVATWRRPEFAAGQTLIASLGEKTVPVLAAARWACIPFSLLGALVCWRWARSWYGPHAGLLALALWCFDPLVIGHGQMITPDVGAAACGVAAMYCYCHWRIRPTLLLGMHVGVLWGCALATKLTWIVPFAGLFVLEIVLRVRGRETLGAAWRFAGHWWLMAGVAVFFLNAVYAFEGSLTTLGSFSFKSRTLSGPPPDESPDARPGWQFGNRFRDSWIGSLPVPLPAQYVLGFDEQREEFERQQTSYLRGEWHRGGWWYYYLYGLAVKCPVATIALFLAATLLVLRRRWWPWRSEEFILIAPAVVVVAFVSSQTAFNHHLRYVLPAFPFLFVWSSRIAAVGARTRGGLWALGAAAAWLIASVLACYPHSFSYFNEVVGGPTQGYRHLLDSNIEWGQDLERVRRWANANPQGRPLYVAAYHTLDPAKLGIPSSGWPPSGPEINTDVFEKPPPGLLGPAPGWFAIGVTALVADTHLDRGSGWDPGLPYCGYFRELVPCGRFGYSMYLYHVTLEEANQLRARLGVPPLPADFQPPKPYPFLTKKKPPSPTAAAP